MRAVEQQRHDVGAAERRGIGRCRAGPAGRVAARRARTPPAARTPTIEAIHWRSLRPSVRAASAEPRRRRPRASPAGPWRPGRGVSGMCRRPTAMTAMPSGHVDQEDPPPRRHVDQPAAEERSHRRRHAAEAGPQRRSPGPARGGRTTPGGWPGCPGRGGRRRRPGRRGPATSTSTLGATAQPTEATREPAGAEQEDAPAAVAVAEGAAEQDERGQRERVAVEDPLQPGERRVEVGGHAGQGEVDDRRVEHRHPRAEDGRQQHPPSGRVADVQSRRGGDGGAHQPAQAFVTNGRAGSLPRSGGR